MYLLAIAIEPPKPLDAKVCFVALDTVSTLELVAMKEDTSLASTLLIKS